MTFLCPVIFLAKNCTVQRLRFMVVNITYSKNIFDVKKGKSKKVQVAERLKSVKSL